MNPAAMWFPHFQSSSSAFFLDFQRSRSVRHLQRTKGERKDEKRRFQIGWLCVLSDEAGCCCTRLARASVRLTKPIAKELKSSDYHDVATDKAAGAQGVPRGGTGVSFGGRVTDAPAPPLPDRLASLTTAYQTLLCLELAQRGVLVKGGAPFGGNGDDQKGGAAEIFDAITSTAGKALFDADTDSLPKPLLAACSAVMAMAAERCADILGSVIAETSNIQLDDLPTNLLLLGAEADVKSSYESAKRRCSEVDDGRLSSLLDLSTNLRGPKASTPDSPPPKSAKIFTTCVGIVLSCFVWFQDSTSERQLSSMPTINHKCGSGAWMRCSS